MAKFQIDVGSWAEDIAKDFNIADRATIPIMKMALYEGADVMANAAKKAANAHGLGAGLGVAPFQTDSDGPQTSVGFRDGGYFTNRWGQTVPYDLVANVLEYGSSKVKATHFMSRAFKAARPKAQEAMRQVVHQKMTELLARK